MLSPPTEGVAVTMLAAMLVPSRFWSGGETRFERCRMEVRRAGAPVGRMLRGWLVGAVSLVLLVGCGGGGESVDASATAVTRLSTGMEGLQGGVQRGMPATVTMTDEQQFEPPRVAVPAGTTVLWRNAGAV